MVGEFKIYFCDCVCVGWVVDDFGVFVRWYDIINDVCVFWVVVYCVVGLEFCSGLNDWEGLVFKLLLIFWCYLELFDCKCYIFDNVLFIIGVNFFWVYFWVS